MKRGIVGLLIGLFLLLLLVLAVAFNLWRPRILVLHSASADTAWAQQLDLGVQAVLKANRLPVAVQWHYLGMDKLHEEHDRVEAATVAQRAIAQQRPAIVLAIDDEAQAYVARHQLAADGPRVVFAAIDDDPATYGYAASPRASGISERLPLAAVREALGLARPGAPLRIAVIGPDDATGRGQLAQVRAFDWAPHRLATSTLAPDFAAWQSAVAQSDTQADVLLVLGFGALPGGAGAPHAVDAPAIAKWTESHARALPVGLAAGFVEGGGGLAITPSAREMGEAAMRLALRWLREPGKPPPVENSAHYRVLARPAALAARQVALPGIYLEAARQEGGLLP